MVRSWGALFWFGLLYFRGFSIPSHAHIDFCVCVASVGFGPRWRNNQTELPRNMGVYVCNSGWRDYTVGEITKLQKPISAIAILFSRAAIYIFENSYFYFREQLFLFSWAAVYIFGIFTKQSFGRGPCLVICTTTITCLIAEWPRFTKDIGRAFYF